MKIHMLAFNNRIVVEKRDIRSLINNEIFYHLAIIFILIIVFVFIEYQHPYFFLNDDNRDYFLPNYIHNYRSILNGELALYNFHQFLGIPHLAIGQAATLYPLVYASTFLSEMIFSHYFATIDILVIIHLVIGALGFYNFIRFLGIEQLISLFGGITWSLSSFVVYVSNSWVIVSAAAAYFPWMLLFSFKMYKNPSFTNSLSAVIARLLLFYAGHIQYFIYSVLFEALTVIIYVISENKYGITGCINNFLKNYISGYIYVLIFSLPVLLPMWNQMTMSADRSNRLPFEVFASRKFLISELISGLTIVGYGDNGYLSHIGIINIYFLLVGLFRSIFLKAKIILLNNVNVCVFIIPAIISLLWSSSTFFNYFIYIIPILNRFRWPFKLAFFLDFYLIVLAVIILSNLIKNYTSRLYRKVLCFAIVLVQLLNFAVLYYELPYSFGAHLDKIPLEERFVSELKEGRIISIGFEIWNPELIADKTNFMSAITLGFNYATLFELNYFAGCEPLRSSTTSEACLGLNFKAFIDSIEKVPIDYLRKAGVCWYLIPKNKEKEYSNKIIDYELTKSYEDEYRIIYFDAKAYPMVFNNTEGNFKIIDYEVSTNTINLSAEVNQDDIIIFNNLYNPFFEGNVDGKRVELIPINDIHFGVSLSKGKHDIKIAYRDAYFYKGIYIILIFILLKFVCFISRHKIYKMF